MFLAISRVFEAMSDEIRDTDTLSEIRRHTAAGSGSGRDGCRYGAADSSSRLQQILYRYMQLDTDTALLS